MSCVSGIRLAATSNRLAAAIPPAAGSLAEQQASGPTVSSAAAGAVVSSSIGTGISSQRGPVLDAAGAAGPWEVPGVGALRRLQHLELDATCLMASTVSAGHAVYMTSWHAACRVQDVVTHCASKESTALAWWEQWGVMR